LLHPANHTAEGGLDRGVRRVVLGVGHLAEHQRGEVSVYQVA
jgi:hypothetical protein